MLVLIISALSQQLSTPSGVTRFTLKAPRAIRDPPVNPPENIKRWKLHGGFSFSNRLYISESVVFERGGPACLSRVGPLFICESVGAEFCLSKQLAAAHGRRLSWRDLFHPEIRLSSSYDSSKQCAASRPEVRSSIKYAIRPHCVRAAERTRVFSLSRDHRAVRWNKRGWDCFSSSDKNIFLSV